MQILAPSKIPEKMLTFFKESKKDFNTDDRKAFQKIIFNCTLQIAIKMQIITLEFEDIELKCIVDGYKYCNL